MSNQNGDGKLVYQVPEAGALLGLSRNASYEAAKRGDFPTIKLGKLIRVPKLPSTGYLMSRSNNRQNN